MQLRPYQQQAVDDLRARFRAGSKAPLLVMPTGSGKTVVFSHIAEGAARKGSRILLLAHRRELILQISSALKACGLPHGMIAPNFPQTSHPVQVASIPTLARRVYPGKYRFDLVVIDEAHHAVAGSGLGKILETLTNARLLGVTATPCRLDGRGLGERSGGFFDALVEGPSVLELIEAGYLAKPVVYAPAASATPDLRGVRKRGGDYSAGQLAEIMDRTALTGDAVDHYRRVCNRQPAIAFCVTLAHAAHVAEQFKAAGYQAATLRGDMPDAERDRLIADLGSGALQVLTSCNVVSEGTDIPIVSAAILLRPTASYTLAMQQMGRVLRIHPGKERAVILDHAGNTRTHGLPTERQEWTLEDRPKSVRKWGEPLTRACGQCGAEVSIASRVCPECQKQFEWVVDIPTSPVVRDEELEEIDAVAAARQRRREVAQARTYEDFQRIGFQRGYRPGWARHAWREWQARQEPVVERQYG